MIGHFLDSSAGMRMGLILVAVKPNATCLFRVLQVYLLSQYTLSMAAKPRQKDWRITLSLK